MQDSDDLDQGSVAPPEGPVDAAGEQGDGHDAPDAAYLEEAVRALGLIFSNKLVYGPDHGVTKKAMDDAFEVLKDELEYSGEMLFSISEDELMLNGTVVEQKNPLIKQFVSTMVKMEVSSFTFTKGLTLEKFKEFIDITNMRPEEIKQQGGFAEVISKRGLENIRARKVIFQQLTEDDVVLSEKELAQKLAGKGGQGDGVTGEDGEGKEEVNLEGILAFLRGKADEDSAAGLNEVASDPRKLADLILKATDVREETAQLEGGESFASLVVGCLRKTYDTLAKDPAVKTQKGKKSLGKTLMLLEKELIDKMRAMAQGVSDDDLVPVTDAFEEMRDEVEIDTLTSDYLKKRSQIESSEKRILRYMKKKGPEALDDSELKDRLIDEGLGGEGWSDLMKKSGLANVPGLGGLASIGHLATLLTQMEEKIRAVAPSPEAEVGKGEGEGEGKGPGEGEGEGKGAAEGARKPGILSDEDLQRVLDEVDAEVGGLTAEAKARIDTLVKEAMAEVEERAQKGLPKEGVMTRKKLFEILAEIGQEICQPLAVITCSLDMLRSKALGTVSEQQGKMLELASSSTDKLKKLADSIIEIAGMPTTRRPDQGIQGSLYDR